MTADVFALFLGIYIFGNQFDALYLIAFFVILAALIGFHVETWRYEKYIRFQNGRPDLGNVLENSNFCKEIIFFQLKGSVFSGTMIRNDALEFFEIFIRIQKLIPLSEPDKM